MPALTCYFDESFHEQIHVVAGYVGTAEMWQRGFSPQWRRALASAPHSLSEFKASDCRNKRNEFRGWTASQSDAMTRELVSVILAHDCAGFAGVFFFPGIPDPEDPRARRERRKVELGGYGISLGLCFLTAFQVAARACGAGSVQPIVDEKHGFYDRMMLNFNGVKRMLGSMADRIKEPVPGDSKAFLPLQAADLLAYETHKEVLSRCELKRKPSKALMRLVEGGFHFAKLGAFAPLKEYQQALARGVKPRTTEHVLYKTGTPLRAAEYWPFDMWNWTEIGERLSTHAQRVVD